VSRRKIKKFLIWVPFQLQALQKKQRSVNTRTDRKNRQKTPDILANWKKIKKMSPSPFPEIENRVK